MKIEKVQANRKGGFWVTYEGNDPFLVYASSGGPHARALAEYIEGGGKIEPAPRDEGEDLAREAGYELLKKRDQIRAGAGDTDAILGTTSDAAMILMYVCAAIVSELSARKSYDEFVISVRERLGEIPGGDGLLCDMLGDFLIEAFNGEGPVPAFEKGIGQVFEDIRARNSAVVTALGSASE